MAQDNTELTEEELWQNAEDERLEYEGYCNKIRTGLEKQGVKSAERAVWELVQNARDQSTQARIKIELTQDCIIFSHHGKPFDYTSFRALVKQDSSKDRTGADQVGQYGTGFMATHIFNRLVHVSAPYVVKKGKDIISGYKQICDFKLDRTKVDTADGPRIMKNQLLEVKEYCKPPLLDEIKDDTTSFRYDLTTEQTDEVSTHLTGALRLMPFVLIINGRIQSVEIHNHKSGEHYTLRKSDDRISKTIAVEGWCEVIEKVSLINHKDSALNDTFVCKSLQSTEGDVILLPPFPASCGDVSDVPSLFLWFPLLGTENFGVNFIFHSKNFLPVEKRNNIMLPGSTIDEVKKGGHNKAVLHRMMKVLFTYYANEDNAKDLSREFCQVCFPVVSEDEETLKFYKELQSMWIAQVPNWKAIPIGEERYSIADANVKLLHPAFYNKLKPEQKSLYETTLANYAKLPKKADGTSYLMPSTELIAWSEIVNQWDCNRDADFFITVADVCNAIKTKSADLHSFLKLMVDSDNAKVMENHRLLPNRAGELRTSKELYHGDFMTDEVYALVKVVMGLDAQKIYDTAFLDVCTVNKYTQTDLQNAITNTMTAWRRSALDSTNKTPLTAEQLDALITFCSASFMESFTNQRARMMALIATFYGKTFARVPVVKLKEDEEDFYKAAFNFLVDYTLYQVCQKDTTWVKTNKAWLHSFLVEYSPRTNEAHRKRLDDYGILPNQKDELCLMKCLRKNGGVPPELAKYYQSIFGKDLYEDWIDTAFEDIVTLTEDKPKEHVASKIEASIVEDMKLEPKDRKFSKIVRDIILKIGKSADWKSWFGQIDDKKATYTFSMKSGTAQESLFSLMDIDDEDLGRLAKLQEKGNLSDIITKMERQLELENEKQTQFNFCLHIGKAIEKAIRSALQNDLFEVVTRKTVDEDLTVNDIQNGQDIIIRAMRGGQLVDVYYIEVKAKWNFDIDTYAHMSLNQLKMAAKHPENYSLCCVDLTDKSKINIPAGSSEEYIEEHKQEILDNTHVHLTIGKELEDIMLPIIDADDDISGTKMRIGDYRGNMTKTAFQNGASFDELVKCIISKL